MFLPTTNGPAHTHDEEPMISSHLPTKPPVMPLAQAHANIICLGHRNTTAPANPEPLLVPAYVCTTHTLKNAESSPNHRDPPITHPIPGAVPRSPAPRRGGPSVMAVSHRNATHVNRHLATGIHEAADRSGWHATDGRPSEKEVKPPRGGSIMGTCKYRKTSVGSGLCGIAFQS